MTGAPDAGCGPDCGCGGSNETPDAASGNRDGGSAAGAEGDCCGTGTATAKGDDRGSGADGEASCGCCSSTGDADGGCGCGSSKDENGDGVSTCGSACGPACGCGEAASASGGPGDEGTPFGLRPVWVSRRARKTWASGLFLAIGLALRFGVSGRGGTAFTVAGAGVSVAALALLAGVAVGVVPFLRAGATALRERRVNLGVLEGTAILVAAGLGLFLEAAVLAFLVNVAELLEGYAMSRVRDSVEDLMALRPDTARVRRDGETETVPVGDVSVGDVLLVRPGERIPIDGTVTQGESAVDESPVTGESAPAEKTAGDDVYAGTVNEAGYLEVEATTTAEETTIADVARRVEAAQSSSADFERYVDRLARYYTPVVAGGAALVAVVPPLLGAGAWEPWFVRGLTLLVIACPCAFVISTPVSVLSGITSGAKRGVLIEGGEPLEALASVDTVAFDKTGTLTDGELSVTDVVPAAGATERDVVEVAAALEARSEHPVADAVRAHADDVGVGDVPDVDAFESLTGAGVAATIDGTRYFVGKPERVEGFAGVEGDRAESALADGGVATASPGERVEPSEIDRETVESLERDGKTVVVVTGEDAPLGVLALADRPRPDARETVEWLHDRGVRTVMITGDAERTARAVASEVGVDEYHADLLPDEKTRVLETLAERGNSSSAEPGQTTTVAMVGDGINDAPALTTATVGVAMGAAGTDAAIETADVALMDDDLSTLPAARRLSERTAKVVRQNVWGSLAVQAVLALAAPLGLVGPVAAVVVGDAGLVLAVTANALRLASAD